MATVGECKIIVNDLLNNDERIRALLQNASGKQTNVRSKFCSENTAHVEGRARAYISTDPTEIVLCVNKLGNRASIREALLHEAVHAYDHENKKSDFETCVGVAYSEVRAAREAECGAKYMLGWFRDQCVKKNAIRSTSNMFGRHAQNCVHEVFESAVNDMEPWAPLTPPEKS